MKCLILSSALLFLGCSGASIESAKTFESGFASSPKTLDSNKKTAAQLEASKTIVVAGKRQETKTSKAVVDLRSLFLDAYRAFYKDKDSSIPLFQAAITASGKTPKNPDSTFLSPNLISHSDDGRLMLICEDESAVLINTNSRELKGLKTVGFYTRQANVDVPDLLSPKGDFIIGINAVVRENSGGENTARENTDVENTDELVIRKVPDFEEVARIAVGKSAPFVLLGPDRVVSARPGVNGARDELIVVVIATGAVESVLLTPTHPFENKAADALPLDGSGINLRAESFVTANDVVGTIWEDKSVSLHRVSTGRLIGLFPGSLHPFVSKRIVFNETPPRAAVSTNDETVRDNSVQNGQTALIDLSTDHVIRFLKNCPWVTDLGFSKDGKTLAVGDLLKVCFHEATTGRLRKKSAQVRARAEFEDDLQNVSVKELENHQWTVMSADGSLGIADSKTGKMQRIGRAAGVFIAEGDTLITGIDTDELLIVQQGRISKRPLFANELTDPFELPPEAQGTKAAAERSLFLKVQNAICVLDGYFLPATYCP
jgi:hypothetical protein